MTDTYAPTYYYPYKSTVKYDVAVTTLRGGNEKRRALDSGRRVIEMGHDGADDAEAAYINGFFDSMGGRLTAFNFYDEVSASTVLVRFDQDEAPCKKDGYNRWSGSSRLIEADS